jgi:V-type H+-transporting ATPase subunit C
VQRFNLLSQRDCRANARSWQRRYIPSMYWLVSLPGSRDATWRALQSATGNGALSDNYRFDLPMSLRVGSLDALMVLSDDLSRVNIMVEGVVNKIRRQASELAPGQAVQVDNRPVASYMTNFHWDEARFPVRKPLKEIVDELTESVVSVDDELKACPALS